MQAFTLAGKQSLSFSPGKKRKKATLRPVQDKRLLTFSALSIVGSPENYIPEPFLLL
jgi:hypothetical protein